MIGKPLNKYWKIIISYNFLHISCADYSYFDSKCYSNLKNLIFLCNDGSTKLSLILFNSQGWLLDS